MEADTKKRLRNIGLCSLVGVMIVGGFWWHQGNIIGSHKDTIHTEKLNIKNNQKDKANFTESKLKKQYDSKYPNLDKVLENNRNQVQKGLDLAFSHSVKPKDFNHNKKAIQHDLGSDVSNKVLNVVQPNTTAVSSNQSISEALDSYKISYGEFDSSNNIIPMMIEVEFHSPKIDKNADSSDDSHPQYVNYHGKVVLGVTYNLNDHSMQLNNDYGEYNHQGLNMNPQNDD